MVKQLKDAGGAIIPLLQLKPGRGLQVSFTSAAAVSSSAITSSVVTITSTVACFVNINNTANKASSHYILANTPYDMSIAPSSYISVIGESASGTLYISEYV